MSDPAVFFEVDTQVDFMLPHGSLYVPGAEAIIPNLKRLIGFARQQGIPVLSSVDAHPPDDPSFAEWPPHCVVGTPGQRHITETENPAALVVPNRPGGFVPPANRSTQIILEKQEYDATTNVNFEAVLAWLGARHFVVFGVATDYCVRWTALSLQKRQKAVAVVTDAVRAIHEDAGRRALEEIAAAGGRLVTTEEVCAAPAYRGFGGGAPLRCVAGAREGTESNE